MDHVTPSGCLVVMVMGGRYFQGWLCWGRRCIAFIDFKDNVSNKLCLICLQTRLLVNEGHSTLAGGVLQKCLSAKCKMQSACIYKNTPVNSPPPLMHAVINIRIKVWSVCRGSDRWTGINIFKTEMFDSLFNKIIKHSSRLSAALNKVKCHLFPLIIIQGGFVSFLGDRTWCN